MNEALLSSLLNQSFSVVAISVILYVMYKYFTGQQEKLMQRMDKREELHDKKVSEKDDAILGCYDKLFEMGKLNNEINQNVLHSLNHLIRLIQEQKT